MKKYILTAILSIFPFFASLFLYPYSVAFGVTLIPVAVFILLFNRIVCENRLTLTVLCTFTFAFMLASSLMSTRLYYNNISPDSGTLLLGNYQVTFLGLIMLFEVIIIIITAKGNKASRKEKSYAGNIVSLATDLIIATGAATSLCGIYITYFISNATTQQEFYRILQRNYKTGILMLQLGIIILLFGIISKLILILKSRN